MDQTKINDLTESEAQTVEPEFKRRKSVSKGVQESLKFRLELIRVLSSLLALEGKVDALDGVILILRDSLGLGGVKHD